MSLSVNCSYGINNLAFQKSANAKNIYFSTLKKGNSFNAVLKKIVSGQDTELSRLQQILPEEFFGKVTKSTENSLSIHMSCGTYETEVTLPRKQWNNLYKIVK